MGLDTTHDAFHGAYSAFNRFRQVVARAIGGSYPPHWVYGEDGHPVDNDKGIGFKMDPRYPDESRWYAPDGYTREEHPGIYEFLCHSDCDGKIKPKMCRKVADELEALLPAIAECGRESVGHIERDGGYVAVTKRFIAGCRAAAAEGVPLEFH